VGCLFERLRGGPVGLVGDDGAGDEGSLRVMIRVWAAAYQFAETGGAAAVTAAVGRGSDDAAAHSTVCSGVRRSISSGDVKPALGHVVSRRLRVA
jgi:hypothetical protein